MRGRRITELPILELSGPKEPPLDDLLYYPSDDVLEAAFAATRSAAELAWGEFVVEIARIGPQVREDLKALQNLNSVDSDLVV